MSPRSIFQQEQFKFKFSICTLANKPDEYNEMLESFLKAGFTEVDCEYIYADNSNGNEFEAFGGINRFLREAKGEFVIICHQDVLITINDRKKLEQQINLVTSLDPNWGVLGNAGINDMYNTSMVMTEAGISLRKGVLPSKVKSLDENFLLLKASANLAVAGDLEGFHMYGTDLCLVAECLGYSAFAIDFQIYHKGLGTVDESFHNLSDQLKKKYSRFFRGRYIRTTITRFYVSSNWLVSAIMNLGIMKSISRFYYKFNGKF
jgi:hypothetical protein